MLRVHARLFVLAVIIGTLLWAPAIVPAAGATRAAAPSLSASGTVAPNLTLTATVRSGPYFAGEALAVQVSLRNLGRQTITLQQANACAFSAQVVVVGRTLSGQTLPSGPLCTGLPSTLTLLPGVQIRDTVITVVPAVSGAAKKTYRISLLTTALLRVPGAAASAHFSLRGGAQYVPFVAPRASTGARPEQNLRLKVTRDAQGFTSTVTDGRNKGVSGVAGWYVVHAPDGDLAWGIAAPGRTYCGAGCQSGASRGTYKLTVMMARDGFSLATSVLSYKV